MGRRSGECGEEERDWRALSQGAMRGWAGGHQSPPRVKVEDAVGGPGLVQLSVVKGGKERTRERTASRGAFRGD